MADADLDAVAAGLMSAPRRPTLAAMVALALLAAACGRRDTGPATQRPAPPDSILASVAPRLGPLLATWRETIPDFEPQAFRFLPPGPEEFTPTLDTDVSQAWFDSPRRRRTLWRFSPDSAYAVDPNVYMDLDEEGNREFEPDNAVALIDPHGGRWRILATCGTPCRYIDAVWLGPRVFVVAGWYEAEGNPPGWNPALIVFDLERHRIWRYQAVPEGRA